MFAPHPKTAQDYQDRADACTRLAEGALSPDTRETMLFPGPPMAGVGRSGNGAKEGHKTTAACR